MSKELTPMQSLQEKMQSHIREKFAEIVPEEVWKGLTDKVISEYVENQLPKMVKEEMAAMATAKIKAMLSSPEFEQTWDGFKGYQSEGMKKLLIEVAPEMFAQIFKNMAQQIAQNMRY